MSERKATFTKDTVTVVYDNEVYTVRRGQANFQSLREALINDQWDKVPKLLTIAKGIEEWSDGLFTVKNEHVYYGDEQLPTDINQRLVSMIKSGESTASLTNFWKRLEQNPSWRSVQQLYTFIKHKNIPITPKGYFLAYKSVKSDLRDHHTGTVRNDPGRINEMPRNKISDDPNVACHYGFHVGTLGYAQGFHSGSPIMICQVDPADVVCVPYDSNTGKVRVCRYKVIGRWVQGIELPDIFEDEEVEQASPETHFEQPVEVTKSEIRHQSDLQLPWEEFGSLSEKELKAQSRQGIRKYAASVKIPRAWKKGKETLIQDIIERRKAKGTDPTPKKAEKSSSEDQSSNLNLFDRMEEIELMDQKLGPLRTYASKHLKIVGASKIPGGKTELVRTIMEVRGKKRS